MKYVFLLYDDWHDNSFTNRNAIISKLSTLSQVNGGLLLIRNWQTNNVSVNNSIVTLNPGSEMKAMPLHTIASSKNIEWEFKARCTYNGIDHALRISLFSDSTLQNRWTHFAPNWQQYGILNYLWKIVNGVNYQVIKATHTGDINWHVIKGKRTSNGNWEIFYDGVSDGITFDTWMPANDWFFIHNDLGTYVNPVELDYIYVKIL